MSIQGGRRKPARPFVPPASPVPSAPSRPPMTSYSSFRFKDGSVFFEAQCACGQAWGAEDSEEAAQSWAVWHLIQELNIVVRAR